jgi:uncharacterized protein (DUF1330 family)
MLGYVLFDVDIIDQDKADKYRQMVPASLLPYGGRFIVRGGKVEELEGAWSTHRFGIIEFPSVEQARAWYGSAEYAPAKALRLEAMHAKLLIVEGV